MVSGAPTAAGSWLPCGSLEKCSQGEGPGCGWEACISPEGPAASAGTASYVSPLSFGSAVAPQGRFGHRISGASWSCLRREALLVLRPCLLGTLKAVGFW